MTSGVQDRVEMISGGHKVSGHSGSGSLDGPGKAVPGLCVTVSLLFGASVEEVLAGFTTIWMHGDHNISTAPHLFAAIRRASNIDESDVMLDLSDVTSIDLATVDVIVSATAMLQQRSLALRSRCPSPSTLRFVDAHGLHWLFDRGSATSSTAP